MALPTAPAQTTWDGGGGDNNWGTGANWSGDVSPSPGTGSDIVFAGTSRTNPFNNYTAFDDFRNILFAAGAGTFNITGNAIDLFGKIENNSTNTQTFALTIGTGSVSGGFIEINPVSGNLVINSADVFLGNNQLRVWGNNGHTATFSSNTVISGAGGSVALNQNSVLVMAGNNTYTGGTTIGAGRLVIARNFTTNVSGVHTAGALGTGGLTLSNGITIVADNPSTIRSNISSTTTLLGDITIGATNSAGLRMASSWNMGGVTRTITLGKASTSYASGNEVLGFINAGGIAPTFGSGTLALATTTGSTSNPSIARFATATFTANAGLSVGDGVAITTQNGNFFATGGNAPTLTLNADAGRGGGILQLGDGISGGNAIMRNAEVYSLSGGGTVSSANTTGTLATGTLTINNGNGQVFSGRITETGGTGRIAVTKSGSGIQTFSGSNNYTGATTISGGALVIANNDALGSTTGATTVNANAVLALSNNIAVGNETLTLNGLGNSSFDSASLASVSGSNSWAGGIAVNSTEVRLMASNAATLSLGGTITSATNRTLYIGGVGTTIISNALSGFNNTSGNGALWKDYTGTLVLLADNTAGLTGRVLLNEGTIVITNANSLGAGQFELGRTNQPNRATLQVNSTTLRTNVVALTDASTNGAISVASGVTFTIGANLINVSGSNALTKFGKAGAGTLVLGGTASTYSGQLQVGEGTVVIGNSASLGTNSSTANRGIDLGLNVGDVNESNNVTLLLSNGVTLSNSIYVSPNTVGGSNYTRTLGIAGTGNAAMNNQIFLDGNLTADAGADSTLTLSGNLTNTGGVIKTGAGTLVLGTANNHTGNTVIRAGAISISADNRLGATPGSFVSNQITLSNGGQLVTTAGFTLGANRGVFLGTGGGGIQVASGFTTINPVGQVISGSGSLSKGGAGTLTLTAANTYSGGSIINEGFVRLSASSILAGSSIASGPLGIGSITINGGGIFGGGQTLNATNIFINSDFAVNQGARGGLNGRLSLGADLINLGGTVRTLSVGAYTNAAGILFGGIESMRFISNATYFVPTITNGTMRFVRDATGTAADFAAVNFGVAGIRFAGGNGFIVGTNIITTFGPGNAFTNTSGDLPHVATETGGIFNLGTTNAVNNQTIRSLSGEAGYVTTLATLASTNTALLTISNQAGDNYNFGGQILTGSELNSVLGTTATNAAIAITKRGQGTQVLSGTNSYGGATTIAEGVLTFANTSAKSSGSQVTVQSNAVIGLGVGAVGGYNAATITSIISNSATGYTMNIGSIVGIDTTAGNFIYDVGIANTRELWKLGANTLTLTAGSGRTGATVVTAGTLELNASAGSAAGGTSSISVRSGATLLVSKSDQVSNTAAVTLSGGTISRGSGVSEVFGDLNITAGSFLDFGTGSTGTLQFQDYTNTGSALVAVQNFLPGNKLQFSSSSFNVGSLANFNFGTADFSTGIQGDYFTITAIPEPSTILAAFGLAGLFGWPFVRRHLRKSPTNS